METTNSSTALVLIPENSLPFTEIYGLTVLVRTCLALDKSGISTIYLPKSKETEIKKWLEKRNDWKVDFQFTDNFEVAIPFISENLVLISEPLVVDLKLIKKLIEQGNGQSEILTTCEEKVLFIPKEIVEKIKADSGITIKSLLKTAPLKEFSKKAINFAPLICMPIRNKEDKRAAKKQLIKSLTKPTDGWVSIHLNRPISTIFSRMLAPTNITPNQVTIINGFVGFLTCYYMIQGGYWNWFIAGFIVHATSVIDGVDGELARLKFKSSDFGQTLDTFFDYSTAIAALVGLMIGVSRTADASFFQNVGLLAVVFAVLAILSLTVYVRRKKKGSAFFHVDYGFEGKTTSFAKTVNFLGNFTKRELYNLLFFLFGVFGLMPWVLVYVAIMAGLVFLFSINAHMILTARLKK